jgi:hypothetical protein
MITRRERAKTQAKIDLVLADIRGLEARGLGWVGAPAPIGRTMLKINTQRPTPIEIGLVIRAKPEDAARGTFALPQGIFRKTPLGAEKSGGAAVTAIYPGARRKSRSASGSPPRARFAG